MQNSLQRPNQNASDSRQGDDSDVSGAAAEWCRSCNICIQGRVEFLTNCGHLLCAKCKEKSPTQCRVCGKACSTMHMPNGLSGLPPEIKILFEPISSVVKSHERKLIQTYEFQKSQQARLISNLRQKMKYMSDKWNQLVNKLKNQEREIADLKQNEEILLQKLQDSNFRLNSSQFDNNGHINVSTFNSVSSNSSHPSEFTNFYQSNPQEQLCNNSITKDFVSNFTPLKATHTNSIPTTFQKENSNVNYSNSNHNIQKPQQQVTQLINPKQRMSVRTPQGLGSGSGISPNTSKFRNAAAILPHNTSDVTPMTMMRHKTPSPYTISPGGVLNIPKSALDSRTPSPRLSNLTLNGSAWVTTSTPGIVSARPQSSSHPNSAKRANDGRNDPDGARAKSHYQHRNLTPNFGIQSQPNTSHYDKNEVASKANSALMRLSQTLAARSMKKTND
ncbi:MAG: hypothetical protein MHMPM18_000764 [Marteilia pararefringens]